MFHFNPASGNVGACSAQAGNCPFGEAVHYSTEEEARAGYEASMSSQNIVSHEQAHKAKLLLDATEEDLKEVLTTGGDFRQAKTLWMLASAKYAATSEGALHYEKMIAAADPGTSERALAQHLLAEGNRLRAEKAQKEELQAFLKLAPNENLPSATKPIAESELVSPVNWSALNISRIQAHGRAVQISDIEIYQAKVDRFVQEGSQATSATLDEIIPFFRIAARFRWPLSPAAQKTFSEAQRKAFYEYSEKIVKKALTHPHATKKIFEVISDNYGVDMVLNEPNVSREFVGDVCVKAVEQKIHYSDTLKKHAREFYLDDARIALAVALKDDEGFHQQEALNKVIMSDMAQEFTHDERMLIAGSLDKFPTTDITRKIIADNLSHVAENFSNQAEKASLGFVIREWQKKFDDRQPKKRWFS